MSMRIHGYSGPNKPCSGEGFGNSDHKKKKNKENLEFSPAQKVNKCHSHVFL